MHQRYRRQTDDRQTTDDRRQTDDRQTTDGRTTTYSEREHEFTFANKTTKTTQSSRILRRCLYTEHFEDMLRVFWVVHLFDDSPATISRAQLRHWPAGVRLLFEPLEVRPSPPTRPTAGYNR